jgi:hypothetical protein
VPLAPTSGLIRPKSSRHRGVHGRGGRFTGTASTEPSVPATGKAPFGGQQREQATAQECSTEKKCAECGNRKICLERILILEIDGILPDEGPHTCSQIIGIFFYRVCCSLIPTNQIPKSFEPCKEHGHARSNAGHTISNKETQKERPKVLFG